MKLVVLDAAPLYAATDSRWRLFADLRGIDVLEVYDRTTHAEVVARCADADAVLTNKVPFTADVMAALPHLKYIGVLATGYNIIDTAAARAAGITVTNIPSYSTQSVAQLTFALLLAITNRVETYTAGIHGGAWAASPDFSYTLTPWAELAGKTMGIVGFGNIGQAVARIAAAFGMKVAVYTSKDASALPQGYTKMALDDLFAIADVLSLHCPLTPDTRGMVDARRLALMKPTAIVLNTARGPLIDDSALAAALTSGTIAAAGIDVAATEPPAADNPLMGLDNCYITPHIAWASTEAKNRLFDISYANLEQFLASKPQNVVS